MTAPSNTTSKVEKNTLLIPNLLQKNMKGKKEAVAKGVGGSVVGCGKVRHQVISLAFRR